MKPLSQWPRLVCEALGPKKFIPDIEKTYRYRQNERVLPSARLVLLAAPATFIGFGLWDLWLEPDSISHTLPMRALCCCVWLVLWASTFFPFFRSKSGWVLSFGALWAYVALICVLSSMSNAMLYGLMGFAYPQIALLVLPNARAIALNHILLILLLNISPFIFSVPHATLINGNFLLFTLCILTYLSAFSIEERDRKMFKLELELEDQAGKDCLSGALNRRYFIQCGQIELDRAVRYSHSIALLFLDIDHFKHVNDTYGHHVGDEAIRLLADTCRECIRSTDMLARIGGEEFAILLPMTDLENAELIAERIRERIGSTWLDCNGSTKTESPNSSFSITVSIGVTLFQVKDTIDSLMQRADAALYRAKQNGRNQVVLG